jgi:hypothetical protein
LILATTIASGALREQQAGTFLTGKNAPLPSEKIRAAGKLVRRSIGGHGSGGKLFQLLDACVTQEKSGR